MAYDGPSNASIRADVWAAVSAISKASGGDGGTYATRSLMRDALCSSFGGRYLDGRPSEDELMAEIFDLYAEAAISSDRGFEAEDIRAAATALAQRLEGEE